MTGITAAGVGSGLDITSIVNGLVSSEKQPQQNQIDTESSQLNAELSAYGLLQSSLSSVGDALTGLTDLGAARTATSSDPSVLDATVTDDAALGTYNISVSQLATAQSLASADFSDANSAVGTGTLSLSVGGAAATNITIDSSNNTLQGVADAINQSDAGVNAGLINDGSGVRLVLSSQTTGAANTINLTVSDDDGTNTDSSGLSQLASANATQTVAAQDANFTLNGLAVTSASNTNDTAVQGLTLNLKQVQTGVPVTLTVGSDTSSVVTAVQKLVTAYNSFNSQAGQLTAYDPSNPSQAGVLLGDSTLRVISDQLQNALINPVADVPSNLNSLVQLGLTTDQNGKLSLDTARLTDALNSNYGDVIKALNGAAANFQTTVTSVSGPEGVLSSRTQSINTQLKDVADQQQKLNDRMDQLQTSLMKQYTAMDTLVSQLQSTSNFLTTQFSSLSSSTDSSSSSTG